MLGSVNRLRDLQILAEEAEAVTAPVTTEKERGNMGFFLFFLRVMVSVTVVRILDFLGKNS